MEGVELAVARSERFTDLSFCEQSTAEHGPPIGGWRRFVKANGNGAIALAGDANKLFDVNLVVTVDVSTHISLFRTDGGGRRGFKGSRVVSSQHLVSPLLVHS